MKKLILILCLTTFNFTYADLKSCTVEGSKDISVGVDMTDSTFQGMSITIKNVKQVCIPSTIPMTDPIPITINNIEYAKMLLSNAKGINPNLILGYKVGFCTLKYYDIRYVVIMGEKIGYVGLVEKGAQYPESFAKIICN